jgi:hypothetical protein
MWHVNISHRALATARARAFFVERQITIIFASSNHVAVYVLAGRRYQYPILRP